MRNKKLNKMLRNEARFLGLCDEWYNEWKKNESQQGLIDKYLRGIDFCIKYDYPSLALIEEEFDKDLLHKNGIFINEPVSVSNLTSIVLLGKCNGALSLNDYVSSEIYVRHNSEVDINATNGAKLFISTYDNCKVHIVSDKYSKVFVYKYGGVVEYEGNVIIRERVAS